MSDQLGQGSIHEFGAAFLSSLRGLTLRVSSWDRIVDQTEGASAAFVRELMRRATLLAVDETGDAVVEDRHVAGALHDLAFDGGALTRSLLGARLRMEDGSAGRSGS